MDHSTENAVSPWRHALESTRQGLSTKLVFVVDHSGSVPGVTGTRAVVSDLGMAGTIGGGAAEQQLIERAQAHRGDPEIIEFRHTPAEGGTLCSGLQVFAVMVLTADDEESLKSIVETLENHRTGVIKLSPSGLDFEPGEALPDAFADHNGSWSYSGPIGLLDTLYLVGGGHVSLAVSRLMATLPYRIVVLDNRTGLPTFETNSFAHEKKTVDYDEIAEHVEGGDRSWVAIMTYGHLHDRRVLEGLLEKDLAYLGLLGSKAKVAQMFAAMKEDGVDPAMFERVHAPLGISIRSHTPEEIAVSLAAEIISVRNGA